LSPPPGSSGQTDLCAIAISSRLLSPLKKEWPLLERIRSSSYRSLGSSEKRKIPLKLVGQLQNIDLINLTATHGHRATSSRAGLRSLIFKPENLDAMQRRNSAYLGQDITDADTPQTWPKQYEVRPGCRGIRYIPLEIRYCLDRIANRMQTSGNSAIDQNLPDTVQPRRIAFYQKDVHLCLFICIRI